MVECLSDNNLTKNYDLRTTPKIIFESLYDAKKARQWFPTIHINHSNEPIDIKQLQLDGIEYIVTVEEAIQYSAIRGTIESIDGKSKQKFEWLIIPNKTVKNWTRLTTKTESNKKYVNWISPLPAAGAAIGLIACLENGFAGMTSAYASTVVAGSASTASQATAIMSGTISKSTGISKTILAAIIISTATAAGVGITVGDAYYSNPSVEYTIYPPQLPAELHGVSLTINNVYSTDSKSEILHYDCDDELTASGSDHTFSCQTENSFGNKEIITTTVSIKKPNNSLDEEATQCISQHYMLPDITTRDYPYLLDLPNISPSRVSDLKNTHIKNMDDYYEKKDYTSAKEHATIILKYFNVNDVQALSTIGNIIRDEDRRDISRTECAIAIHSTPFVSNTVWGKISLAEDYHVLEEYEKSTFFSSWVIDNYESNPEIHEINYVNALIIKGNALYRIALTEQSGFEDAKAHYTLAHNIKKSYDTWFGLGNIDRHENKFEDALEKYQQAKYLAEETDEIDSAINLISFK